MSTPDQPHSVWGEPFSFLTDGRIQEQYERQLREVAEQQIEREDTFDDELEGQMYIARTNPALFKKLAAERYLKAAEMRLEELRAERGNTIPPADPQGIDDTDFMVVVIPPVEWKLGMRSFETLTVQKDGYDIVVYEWSKFLGLLLKSNPNVVGTLWLESEDALLSDLPAVQTLFANRNDLMSMKLAPAFVGYAKSQLYKMTHCASEGYMGAKRKALVAEHGYDVKNAAHLIRLLRMGIEALETGRIIVRRPDADELVTIKRGGWTLDRVSDEAKSLFTRADVALANTKLPAAPDWDFVDMIVREGYLQHWARKGHR